MHSKFIAFFLSLFAMLSVPSVGVPLGKEVSLSVDSEEYSVTPKSTSTTHTLTVTATGPGSVTSTPPGINCYFTTCSAEYNYNTLVQLTANDSFFYAFTGWSGPCTISGQKTCTVTMTQDIEVGATFSAIPIYFLSVSRAGTGSGTVTGQGINCGEDCNEIYYSYPPWLPLTATPAVGSRFSGWSGGCSGTGECHIDWTKGSSVTATATFEAINADFYVVPPCRVLDTRITGAPLVSGVPRTITVAGTCGVPSTAKAVSLNLTAIMAPGQGFITLYPDDATRPNTSTMNFTPFLNRANNAVVPLAWNGNGTLVALASIAGGGTIHIVLDVSGYFE